LNVCALSRFASLLQPAEKDALLNILPDDKGRHGAGNVPDFRAILRRNVAKRLFGGTHPRTPFGAGFVTDGVTLHVVRHSAPGQDPPCTPTWRPFGDDVESLLAGLHQVSTFSCCQVGRAWPCHVWAVLCCSAWPLGAGLF
jgi:hypothetical protein